MPSPIIARADALMQRRRQNQTGPDEVPVLVDALDDDDIPILLQVDMPAAAEAPPPAEPALTATAPLEAPGSATETHPEAEAAQQEYIVRELTRRIEARLSAELPSIVAATIRDFLAEHNQGEDPPPHS